MSFRAKCPKESSMRYKHYIYYIIFIGIYIIMHTKITTDLNALSDSR